MPRPALSRSLVAVVLVAGLAACGSSDDGDEPAAAPAPATSDAPAASTAPSTGGASAGTTLIGTLGTQDNPDAFEIGLTDESGREVTSLPAGDYTIRVADGTEIHNWALSGDGVDVATDVSGTGEETFQVTLAAGEYTFVCDPHPSMQGTLTVT